MTAGHIGRRRRDLRKFVVGGVVATTHRSFTGLVSVVHPLVGRGCCNSTTIRLGSRVPEVLGSADSKRKP
jgi:hypothetical protein